MRRAGKVDENQSEIVDALRRAGMSVQPLSSVGSGVPDLLVGFRGVNVLLEVKDGNKALSAQKLTTDQSNWHGAWAGQVTVTNCPDDAVCAVLSVAKRMGVEV
jgi:hypothetical protein